MISLSDISLGTQRLYLYLSLLKKSSNFATDVLVLSDGISADVGIKKFSYNDNWGHFPINVMKMIW